LHLVIVHGLFQLSHIALQIVAFPLCTTFSIIYTVYLITVNLKQISSYIQEANNLQGTSHFHFSVVCLNCIMWVFKLSWDRHDYAKHFGALILWTEP
jgi:hypothetical protein